MPAPAPDARSQLAEVISVEACGRDGILFTVRPEERIERLAAGRFFMLRREDSTSPTIPRPFSLYRQDGELLTFLVKVIGPGTKALAACPPGHEVRLIGPLGNGWPPLSGDGPPIVMLAGGIGSAPFYGCILDCLEGVYAGAVRSEELTLIYGAATSDQLYELEAFEALGVRAIAATDDGSRGFAGNVVACLEGEWQAGRLPREVRLLACGPDPMLRAVERLAAERGLACWFSLETLMACGVGICNGCVVPTREEGPMGEWPHAKCCLDGPVFAAESVRVGD